MTDSDLQRLRVVRRAKALFARLTDAGCERDAAGNRKLRYSHYASLVLLGLFNPAMQSLRLNATARTAVALDRPVRRVVIARRDQGRPRGDRVETDEVVVYTSLLDPPAEVLAAIYALRWSVELFFRFLKQVLGLKRLFSDKPEAVAIQVYCAVIAALLLARAVGGRVTADAFQMLSFYLQGWADDEELLAFLTELREREA